MVRWINRHGFGLWITRLYRRCAGEGELGSRSHTSCAYLDSRGQTCQAPILARFFGGFGPMQRQRRVIARLQPLLCPGMADMSRPKPAKGQDGARGRPIDYTGYTGGIQGVYRGYTGGKALAWEAIATNKRCRSQLHAGSWDGSLIVRRRRASVPSLRAWPDKRLLLGRLCVVLWG